MLRQRTDQASLFVLGIFDLATTILCWIGAYLIRWTAGFVAPVESTPPFWWCVRSVPLLIIAALFSYRMAGLYQVGRRLSLRQELLLVMKATGLLLLILLATTFYAKDPYESRLASTLFWATTSLSLIVNRRAFGWYFHNRKKLGSSSRALIIGTGRNARRVEKALRRNNWLAVTPMGFVDDHSNKESEALCPTVGTIDELPALIEAHRIDYVFVALPLDRFGEIKRIVRSLTNVLVEVRLVPDMPAMTSMSTQVGDLEGLPVLNMRGTKHGFGDAVVKRAMDVVLSAIGLIVLSPVFAVIATLIKLNDRGPIFYTQERMGLNGHRFHMIKFRSMRVNAEDSTGPVWAIQGDNRRTKLGTFLRETSLDELPQLFNVLVGDMSLVGPRPERPFFIQNFRESIPKYMLRHAVKAGMTGWAQVNGWRGNTSLRKRVQYDLYYVANWSIWLDLRILFTTVLRTMWDRNAY